MAINVLGKRTFPNVYQPSYRSDQAFILGNPVNETITAEYVIENYLVGLPLKAIADNADLTSIVPKKIDVAVGKLEMELGSFLVPRVIVTQAVGNPANITLVAGQDYDLLEVAYDYTADRFRNWALMKTRHRPVIDVQSMLFALPPNFGILQVPPPWITVDPNSGMIRIVPVEGAMAVTSPGAGMWLPFFTMGQMNHVPQFVQVNYTAGIYPLSEDIIDLVSKYAAVEVLKVYNQAYYPGVQNFSHSVGGFSQSVSLRGEGPFSAQIKEWKEEIKEYISSWKKSHNGLVVEQLGR